MLCSYIVKFPTFPRIGTRRGSLESVFSGLAITPAQGLVWRPKAPVSRPDLGHRNSLWEKQVTISSFNGAVCDDDRLYRRRPLGQKTLKGWASAEDREPESRTFGYFFLTVSRTLPE